MTNENYFGQSIHPIEILLVDDDDADVHLTTKSFEKDRIHNRVHRVEDGVEAMEYLRRVGSFKDSPRPDLILLDLNMPRKNGREVLREIKEDPHLRTIPVVVLTTSDDDRDVISSYEHQASSYVSKPVDLDAFREILQSLRNYWFSVVRLPPS